MRADDTPSAAAQAAAGDAAVTAPPGPVAHATPAGYDGNGSGGSSSSGGQRTGGSSGSGGVHGSPGGSLWAEPLPPPQPSAQPGSGPVYAHLGTDQIAFFVAFAAQCLLWVSVLAQADTWAAKMQPALVAALTFIGLAVSTRAPRFYWRHRSWLLPCLRIAVLLVPSARSTKVGSAWILERAPRTGRFGALTDLVRLSYGNRVILICAQGLVQLLPPLPALITQAAAAALTANAQGYCRTALMSHPTTRQRLGRVAAALELAAAPPMAAVVPLGSHLAPQLGILSGEAASEPVCQAVLTFFHAAGDVLLPVLVSAWCWTAPAPLVAPPARPANPQEPKRLLHRLAAAAAAANRALHCLLTSRQWWWGAWWLLALAWVCSKTAAGLP